MGRLLNSHPNLFCDFSENNAYHQDFEYTFFSSSLALLHSQTANFFKERVDTLFKYGLIANLTRRCTKYAAKKIGDKSPRQDIAAILQVFPKAQIVIMVRDYRDMCVSLAFHQSRLTGTWEGIFTTENKQTIDNRFLSSHLKNYERHKDLSTYTRFAREKPSQVLIVKYEELKTAPVQKLKDVFAFFEVDHSASIVHGCLETNKFEKLSGGRMPGEEDSGSFFRKGVVGDWRNYFSPENIETFKRIAGTTLVDAGYEKDNNWSA
jgi:hypothetical protein